MAKDFVFIGKVSWRSDVIKKRDLDGQVNFGQKFVLESNDETQALAFMVWGKWACDLINQNWEDGVFRVSLHFNVFEYKGNYHTNIRCTNIELMEE